MGITRSLPQNISIPLDTLAGKGKTSQLSENNRSEIIPLGTLSRFAVLLPPVAEPIRPASPVPGPLCGSLPHLQ